MDTRLLGSNLCLQRTETGHCRESLVRDGTGWRCPAGHRWTATATPLPPAGPGHDVLREHLLALALVLAVAAVLLALAVAAGG